MSGYDVKQFLESTIAHFWNESYGQIYPTLKALEAEGLVEGHDDEGDGRGRRVYTLTRHRRGLPSPSWQRLAGRLPGAYRHPIEPIPGLSIDARAEDMDHRDSAVRLPTAAPATGQGA